MSEVEKRGRRVDREEIAGGVESTVSSRSKRAGFWRTGGYLSLVAIALWFGIWFAITEDGFALMRPIMFPSPAKVIEAVGRISHLLAADVGMTMMRVLVGFTLGTLLGIGLGLQMAYNRKVFHFFNPLVESIRPVPVIAMIPFFLMWFGINEPGKLILITLGVFAIVVVSTLEAVRNVPPIFLRAGETLGASKYQLFPHHHHPRRDPRVDRAAPRGGRAVVHARRRGRVHGGTVRPRIPHHGGAETLQPRCHPCRRGRDHRAVGHHGHAHPQAHRLHHPVVRALLVVLIAVSVASRSQLQGTA